MKYNMTIKEWIKYIIDILLARPNLDEGFIEINPELDDYIHDPLEPEILGAGKKKKVLMADGQYMQFRPGGELQKKRGHETMACVSYSGLNEIEIIINCLIYLVKEGKADQEQKEIVKVFRHFGLIKNGQSNCSDRYIAKLSGTTKRGNNFKAVAMAIRKFGLIPEGLWPWADGWKEYYKDIPFTLIDIGKGITEYIDFGFGWIDPIDFNKAKKYGPIQTSVYAWPPKKNGIYQRSEIRRNHAVVNDGFKMEEYDNIFDSYAPFDKKVSWYFNLGWGMQYTISLKKPLKKKFNQKHIDELMERGYKYIFRPESHGEVMELTKDGLIHYMPQKLIDEALLFSINNKKTLPINEEYYNNLLN